MLPEIILNVLKFLSFDDIINKCENEFIEICDENKQSVSKLLLKKIGFQMSKVIDYFSFYQYIKTNQMRDSLSIIYSLISTSSLPDGVIYKSQFYHDIIKFYPEYRKIKIHIQNVYDDLQDHVNQLPRTRRVARSNSNDSIDSQSNSDSMSIRESPLQDQDIVSFPSNFDSYNDNDTIVDNIDSGSDIDDNGSDLSSMSLNDFQSEISAESMDIEEINHFPKTENIKKILLSIQKNLNENDIIYYMRYRQSVSPLTFSTTLNLNDFLLNVSSDNPDLGLKIYQDVDTLYSIILEMLVIDESKLF
jgi:hypothetical protein